MAHAHRNHRISVTLGRRIVVCDSAADATAIDKAARILNREDSAHSPDETERLAAVLNRYGCVRAARTLRRRAHYG
jgi:hypothetical protein